MLKVSRYEHNLTHRCYFFSKRIIVFAHSLPNRSLYWVLGNQLLRSGTSIGANLVEGSASSTRKEFARYHSISLRSANETKYWLKLLIDQKNVDKQEAQELLDETIEIADMIAAGILRLKFKSKKIFSNSKFKI